MEEYRHLEIVYFTEKLEKIVCGYCGSKSDNKKIYYDKNVDGYRCKNCGNYENFEYISPPPKPKKTPLVKSVEC